MADDFDFDAAPSPPGFDFLEYDAPDAEKWRVERGAALIEDFQLLGPEDVPTLHEAIAGQEPAWLILRRLYAIAPMMGVEEPDDLRVWPAAELATKLGLTEPLIESHLAGARTYWRRWKLENSSGKSVPVQAAKPVPTDDKVEQLLREQGFVEIENADERAYIALRIEQMGPWLESDNLRSAARSAIQQEVTIQFVIDPTIRELRKAMKNSSVKGGSKEDKEMLMRLVKTRSDAQTALEGTLKSLGMTEAQGGGLRKKLAFNDCLSTCVDGIRDYYDKEDRRLIDGLFTAAECELLLSPTELRPIQYRPDLVLMALEASQHLWEREWSPTPISRRACRKLTAGFGKGLADARAEGGEAIEELEISDTDELSEADGETSGMPIEAAPAGSPGQSTTTIAAPLPAPRASRSTETAVMMTS